MGEVIGQTMQKWLWCSWVHRKHRCYPEVWEPKSNFWHCTKCHPCSEGLLRFIDQQQDMPADFAKTVDEDFWKLLR